MLSHSLRLLLLYQMWSLPYFPLHLWSGSVRSALLPLPLPVYWKLHLHLPLFHFPLCRQFTCRFFISPFRIFHLPLFHFPFYRQFTCRFFIFNFLRTCSYYRRQSALLPDSYLPPEPADVQAASSPGSSGKSSTAPRNSFSHHLSYR